jgi:hypothetical protein
VEDATANICRLLKEHPEMVEKMRILQVKAGNPKSTPGLRAFVGAFNELRDLTHLRLASTVEDERARNLFFAGILAQWLLIVLVMYKIINDKKDMVSKEKKMSGDLRVLIDKLAEARQQRERDSTARKAQLAVSISKTFLNSFCLFLHLKLYRN